MAVELLIFLKSEVRAIATILGVSKEIIIVPSTDGLFGDIRTDKGQMGVTHDDFESLLRIFDSSETVPSKIFLGSEEESQVFPEETRFS